MPKRPEQRIVVPHNWELPESMRQSIAEVPGTQRAIEAEGHLILILHKLPIAGSSQRELGMFWRSSDGTWKSNELGGGIQALQRHVNEYGNRALELEDMENKAVAADDFFYVRNEIAPVHRAAKNMFAAISRAYEILPTDKGLLICRNLAASVERTTELLKDDVTYGIEYAMAKQAEAQSLASHRLNLIAAVFFPILSFAAIFGMNLDHGFEGKSTWVFWSFVAVGVSLGLIMKVIVFTKTKVDEKG